MNFTKALCSPDALSNDPAQEVISRIRHHGVGCRFYPILAWYALIWAGYKQNEMSFRSVASQIAQLSRGLLPPQSPLPLCLQGLV